MIKYFAYNILGQDPIVLGKDISFKLFYKNVMLSKYFNKTIGALPREISREQFEKYKTKRIEIIEPVYDPLFDLHRQMQ